MNDATVSTQDTPAVEVPVPAGHRKFTFHFRTEKLRDEKGEVIGEGKKLPNVEAILPVPTESELIDFLATPGKERDYLLEVVSDAIGIAARGQINTFREEHPNDAVTPDILDLSKLTFSSIASTDKRDRAVEIPEEVMNTFFADYKSVMTALGIEDVRIAKHIALFKNQFKAARYDKPSLNMLKDRLSMYAAKTENMDDNEQVYGMLTGKLDKYLAADEKKLIEAL